MQYHCCVVDWQCRARALTRAKGKTSTSQAVGLLRDGLQGMLSQLQHLENEDDEDGIYQSHTEKEVIEPATEATRVWRLPAWAGKCQNLLGLVPFSRCHYFGVMAINDSIIEALLSTGGAKSLVDVDTVEQMGLEAK